MKRPRFDPQSSHNDRNLHGSRDIQIGGASVQHQDESQHLPTSPQENPNSQYPYEDRELRQRIAQQWHQASVSPVHENDRWASSTARWDSQAAYVPSPEPRHAVVASQPGQSVSATDVSSSRPTNSTPESQQTSNTSYRESDTQLEHSKPGPESNDSFYWHSGKSSSDSEEAESNETTTATPGGSRSAAHNSVGYEIRGLPTRSTSLSDAAAVSYGASALGFGGPSDWEYFGDYEAEEVDDEDLYTHRPPAELPADYARSEEAAPRQHIDIAGAASGIQDRPCVLERPATRQLKEIDSEEGFQPQTAEDGSILASKWSPSTTTPTTPRTNPSRPLTTTEPMPPEDQRPDLDEVIRAWSDAPYVGRSSEGSTSHRNTTIENERRENVAAASLASTPGEHFLGANASAWETPSVPKLPDTIDRDRPLQTPLVSHGPAPPGLDEGHPNNREPEQSHRKSIHEDTTYVPIAETHPSSAKSDSRLPNHPSTTADSICLTQEMTELSVMVSSRQPSDSLSVKTGSTSNSHNDRNGSTSVKHVQPALDRSITSSDGPRGEKESTDSPLSEFARKRQMFESPSGRQASPPILPRKLPKEKKSQVGFVATSMSGPGSAIATSLVVPAVSHSSLQDPHQRSIGVGQSDGINRAGSLKDSQKIRDELSSETLPHITHDVSHNVSESSATVSNQEASPLDSKWPSLSPSRQGSREQMQEEAAATVAEVPLQKNAKISSLKASPDNSRRGSETFSIRNVPDDSQEKPVSEQSERASFSGEDLSHASVPLPNFGVATEISEQTLGQQRKLQPQSSQILVLEDLEEKHERETSTGKILQPASEFRPLDDTSITKAKDDLAQSESLPPASRVQTSNHDRLSSYDHDNDPYADLDPWGRASLNRFAAMLREEARVESHKEKLNIFEVFTTRESRLRVVLYGTDDELILPPKPNFEAPAEPRRAPVQSHHTGKLVKGSISLTNSMKLQPSAKALPPLPPNSESVITPPTSRLAALVTSNIADQASLVNGKGLEGSSPKSVAILPEDCPQYSPGGRPIVSRPARNSRLLEGIQAETSTTPDSDAKAQNEQGVTSTNPLSADTLMSHGPETGIQDRNLARANLRSNDGRSEVKNYLTNRRSVYRPFATQTMESLENAISFGREPGFNIGEPPVPIVIAPTSQYNLAAREKDSMMGAVTSTTTRPMEEASKEQSDLRRFVDADFDPLVMILPEVAAVSDTAQLADLRSVMEAIPEDFSFIHASVVAWDAKVKELRAENERQRHTRQAESEQRIDSLFDDHEIGYGDIAELESEFKRSEAARKAEEDRVEYQTFVEDVFNLVWTRLHYELDQLVPHYDHYGKLMNTTLAGKEMFEASPDGLALAPTMNTFLGLHQKLEIRHQKAFEAVLERDRRLKKTEISPWYTLSNIPKVKQLEKQFEDAEKKAIIEYCQERDERANKLMDVLDHNTLRGVGANQDYMEAIMKAVRRIASGRAFISVPGSDVPSGGIELVQKAKDITTLLATSSEQIVQTFHVADMLLNSADYEVSVAKAKVAKADVATLINLKEERTKEDQKLMRDLEHRLALIREDSRRTNDEIIKLMLFLGVQNGRAMGAQPAPAVIDVVATRPQATLGTQTSEHEARIQRALEEAKRRNRATPGEFLDHI